MAIAADDENRVLAGRILLEVSGTVAAPEMPSDVPDADSVRSVGAGRSGEAAAHRFDFDALLALPQTAIETHTDWTDGPQQFEGVRLADLVDHVGAEGSVITAYGLNDYHAEIPVSDLSRHDILIAHTWNGERMRVRDRGPLWVIYPSDNSRSGEPDIDNSKMVWQLHKLHMSEQ